MAVEFFNRGDFFPVLVGKYLSVIKVVDYFNKDRITILNSPDYLEKMLASGMCLSAMSQKEKIQLMVMALERTRYALEIEQQTPCNIMISIMKSCKYGPFMKDIEPRLVETSPGYTMRDPDGEIASNALMSRHRDIIIKYAKQFLNKQKL